MTAFFESFPGDLNVHSRLRVTVVRGQYVQNHFHAEPAAPLIRASPPSPGPQSPTAASTGRTVGKPPCLWLLQWPGAKTHREDEHWSLHSMNLVGHSLNPQPGCSGRVNTVPGEVGCIKPALSSGLHTRYKDTDCWTLGCGRVFQPHPSPTIEVLPLAAPSSHSSLNTIHDRELMTSSGSPFGLASLLV